MGISDGTRHNCSTSTTDAVKNLTTNLPKNVQDKLALEMLKERQTEDSNSQTIFLPPLHWGLPVPVLVGHKAPTQVTTPIPTSPIRIS